MERPSVSIHSHMQQRTLFRRFAVQAIGALFLCSFMVLLSACTNPFYTPTQGHTNASGTDTPLETTPSPSVVVSPTPKTRTITLQVVGSCPSINWDSLVGTKANVNKVQKVSCGALEGAGTLQALINVGYYSQDAKMDFYVYDNLSGTPTQRFKGQGLLEGDAQISPTGTITTAEIGPNGVGRAIPDVFKEYQWNSGTGTFTQILFPGIYPDVTHYQAEQSQATVNGGNQTWKNSGTAETSSLAEGIFHWTQDTCKSVTFDSHKGIYIIQCTNGGPGGGGFNATLFRLDNVTTNIFEIMKITPLDGNTAISSPTTGSTPFSSPLSVSGSATAGGNTLGHVVVYDDAYTIIGDSGAIASPASSGVVNFANAVSYQLSAHGVQEAVVVFYTTNQNNINLINQVVMVKVFLTA